jgi:hypothetical protein
LGAAAAAAASALSPSPSAARSAAISGSASAEGALPTTWPPPPLPPSLPPSRLMIEKTTSGSGTLPAPPREALAPAGASVASKRRLQEGGGAG